MQSPELLSLPLTPKWRAKLLRAGYLTAAEVLLVPSATLAKKTSLPPADVHDLILEISRAVQDFPSTAPQCVADILGLTDLDDAEDAIYGVERSNCITFGDEGLDHLLGGGVRTGAITEFVGEAASGKSHICLQLALTTQLPVELGGLLGGTILISSEGTLPSQRLLSLARSLSSRLPPSTTTLTSWDFMDNIHTIKASNMDALTSILSYVAPALIEALATHSKNSTILPTESYSPLSNPPPEPFPPRPPKKPPLPIRLIIVDSIAAPIRADYETDSSGFIQRSKDLNFVSDALKKLAHVYSCAIVVINQVSAVFAPDSSQRPLAATPGGAHSLYNFPPDLYNRYQGPHFSGELACPTGANMAALGHSWANAINSRVMLTRTFRKTGVGVGEGEGEGGQTIRMATVVFSPTAMNGSVDFVVDGDGVRSLESGT